MSRRISTPTPFELNPNWSRSFSPQPEIQDYLRGTAQKYGVLDKHLFGTEVTLAEWDEQAELWRVQTTNGAFTADLLVPAVGVLCEPSLPDIAGIESFQGDIFHSSRWNHDADLTGKRVAVIGTGASAIQIVPAIADQVAHLDIYQRTARGSCLDTIVRTRVRNALSTSTFPARSGLRARRSTGVASPSCSLRVPAQGADGAQRMAERLIAKQCPTPSYAPASHRTGRSAASGSSSPTTGTRR